MRYFLFACALVLLSSCMAIAAEISPQYVRVNNNKIGVLWENVTTGDTTGEAQWTGGCGIVEFADTFAAAEAELYLSVVSGSTKSTDGDAAPDGLSFTSASKLISGFWFPRGYATINYGSAGTSTQSHDIYLVPEECKD